MPMRVMGAVVVMLANHMAHGVTPDSPWLGHCSCSPSSCLPPRQPGPDKKVGVIVLSQHPSQIPWTKNKNDFHL